MTFKTLDAWATSLCSFDLGMNCVGDVFVEMSKIKILYFCSFSFFLPYFKTFAGTYKVGLFQFAEIPGKSFVFV